MLRAVLVSYSFSERIALFNGCILDSTSSYFWKVWERGKRTESLFCSSKEKCTPHSETRISSQGQAILETERNSSSFSPCGCRIYMANQDACRFHDVPESAYHFIGTYVIHEVQIVYCFRGKKDPSRASTHGKVNAHRYSGIHFNGFGALREKKFVN